MRSYIEDVDYYDILSSWAERAGLTDNTTQEADQIRVRTGRAAAAMYLDRADAADEAARSVLQRACDGDVDARSAVLSLRQGDCARSYSGRIAGLLRAGWGCPYEDEHDCRVQTWCWERVRRWLDGEPHVAYQTHGQDVGPTIPYTYDAQGCEIDWDDER